MHRDPHGHQHSRSGRHRAARKLAQLRGANMTEAIAHALKAELKRERDKRPLEERLGQLSDQLRAEAGPYGHELTKEEIDALWGK
jgi:hypothetical protein